MIKRLLFRLLGRKVRIIMVSEVQERYILQEMRKIKGIRNYLELQVQGGYQLFAKSGDSRYLGYSDLAETILNLFDDLAKPEEEDEPLNDGYESTA